MSLAIQAHAHNPAHASFEIFASEGKEQLRVEFTWSMRNTLVANYPFLSDEGTTDETFSSCLEESSRHRILDGMKVCVVCNPISVDDFHRLVRVQDQRMRHVTTTFLL